MSLKKNICLIATTAALTACGGGSSNSGQPASQEGSSDTLASALTNGNSLQDAASHWLCETTNSPLTIDGINQNEFRFFSDFTGRQGDTDIGADQGITWTAISANNIQVTFTDTDPATQSNLASIVFNSDNTEFTTQVEELVGINLSPADYRCSLIDNSNNGEPPAPTEPDANDPTLAQRLISDGTAETGHSWTCTYADSGETHTYGFNADGTGSDFSFLEEATTGIDFVISEPSSIRATFFNNNFASLLWNQITFQDNDNFTAADGLSSSGNAAVSCTRGAPSAPPAPEPPAPISAAACPCNIKGITDFLNTNASASTFVIASSFAGGQSADIDVDGDSLIDLGVIVRDTGIRDCRFDPFSAEFGVEDPGTVSLSATQATACMNDLNDLLNTEL